MTFALAAVPRTTRFLLHLPSWTNAVQQFGHGDQPKASRGEPAQYAAEGPHRRPLVSRDLKPVAVVEKHYRAGFHLFQNAILSIDNHAWNRLEVVDILSAHRPLYDQTIQFLTRPTQLRRVS